MRIRTIKPEFWKSQTLSMLSAETRLLAIALLNYADDEGYFFAHPALIRGELMPFAESHAIIPGMLKELEEAEYIRLGEDSQKRHVGMVVNFKKHQRVDKPQRSKIAGTVDFPNYSPSLPGILPESSPTDQGSFLAGMEGNGKGMEEEGNGRGSGEPSPDKPGGRSDSAGSSISEPAESESKPTVALPTPPDSPKKKEGRGAGTEVPPDWREHCRPHLPEASLPDTWAEVPIALQRRIWAELAKKKKGGADPEFPDEIGEDYRHALRQWWHYKRERREGYKASGWAALIRQQLRYPPEQVLASVEASMASNWAGLFTEKCGGAVDPGRGKPGAKKEEGAAAVPVIDREPDGWREAWKKIYPFPPPDRWGKVPESNRDDVRRHLRGKGGEA